MPGAAPPKASPPAGERARGAGRATAPDMDGETASGEQVWPDELHPQQLGAVRDTPGHSG